MPTKAAANSFRDVHPDVAKEVALTNARRRMFALINLQAEAIFTIVSAFFCAMTLRYDFTICLRAVSSRCVFVL